MLSTTDWVGIIAFLLGAVALIIEHRQHLKNPVARAIVRLGTAIAIITGVFIGVPQFWDLPSHSEIFSTPPLALMIIAGCVLATIMSTHFFLVTAEEMILIMTHKQFKEEKTSMMH